jgi:hypothetical protein
MRGLIVSIDFLERCSKASWPLLFAGALQVNSADPFGRKLDHPCAGHPGRDLFHNVERRYPAGISMLLRLNIPIT